METQLSTMETQHDALRQQYLTDVGALLGRLRELSQTIQADNLTAIAAIARLETTSTKGEKPVTKRNNIPNEHTTNTQLTCLLNTPSQHAT